MFRRSLGMLVILFLLCQAGYSAQRTFISAGTGNDANLCTRQAPCRNFAAAILQTDPNGEVVVLDSGGYGVVSISGPISLIAPPGVHAAITAFSGSAVEISAGSLDVVVLRGLYLNALGGGLGIRFLSGRRLHVESSVISGFLSHGLIGNAPNSYVSVKDTISRENGGSGFLLGASGSIRASLDGIRAEENNFGVVATTNANVTVSRSAATGNSSYGFAATLPSSEISLESCTTAQNSSGVYSGGIARVSRTIITGNTTGVSAAVGASTISFGNNSLDGNTTNGTFTSNIGQQ